MDMLANAEKRADRVREVKDFTDFSLVGVREKVKEVLNVIGRVEGVFSTYTLHDISHVDAMLGMLDWIIPPETVKAMTHADWLLIVLAVYLHDLGMVVSKEEYEERNENTEFRDWFEGLDKKTEGRDYIARTKRMTETEKDRFFFQEFIRKGHAERIAEWITGRISERWGKEVKPIAEAVGKLLAELPGRFREFLALVCASHHLDNLDDTAVYGLCEPCGGDVEQGIVNVQYAAILLRTVDLLHVTKDRTPSIMYQIVGLTDPKAVTEWDKQRGAFAVRMKARRYDSSNPDSKVILICADFTKEEPLFALQQYITYTNRQISQSKRWADKSQQKADGEDYFFPWLEVRGDVRLEGEPPQPLRFELDRGRLLNLLVGHTIYNDATVAVRELLQNGIDAVRYQQYLDCREARSKGKEAPSFGKVSVQWDAENRTLVVEDNGVGMDRDVIENHLMCVGASYYQTARFRDEERDFNPISRFGIGILTCFMISEDFEIVTCKDGKGHRIRMTTVEVDYLLRELGEGASEIDGLKPHGTRVTLRVRDTVDLSKRSMEDIVRHWVIMPECAVEYQEKGESAERIGFGSTAEALRFYYEKEEGDGREAPRERKSTTRYIAKKREVRDEEKRDLRAATYELGICVEQSWAPEWMFANPPKGSAPSVCIEGIRVANELPGFKRELKPYAMLSVRGDQKFRTTVSREDLEEDEKYEVAGEKCAEMLFEHVTDEIERISNKEGRPLSQASAASHWLASPLFRACNRERTLACLTEVQAKAARMVIERVVKVKSGNARTRREMISEKQLAEEEELWSVESRLVDSLGTLSCDLGRELSLNEFLLSLVPELVESRYSPLLPDAHIFRGVLRKSHRAYRVECSRRHQQSATKWVRRSGGAGKSQMSLYDLIGSEEVKRYHRYLRNLDLEEEEIEDVRGITGTGEIDSCERCEIDGDGEDFDCVNTRVVVIIREGSELANVYGGFVAAIKENCKRELDFCKLFTLMKGASILLDVVLSGRGVEVLGSRRFRGDVGERAGQIWKRDFAAMEGALKEFGVRCRLPENLPNFAKSIHVFDATSFWLDWWTRE